MPWGDAQPDRMAARMNDQATREDEEYCPKRDGDGIPCEKERGHEPPCVFID